MKEKSGKKTQGFFTAFCNRNCKPCSVGASLHSAVIYLCFESPQSSEAMPHATRKILSGKHRNNALLHTVLLRIGFTFAPCYHEGR